MHVKFGQSRRSEVPHFRFTRCLRDCQSRAAPSCVSRLDLSDHSTRMRIRGDFLRSVLRSSEILLQNGAILRNTPRMLNLQTPSAGNAAKTYATR